MFPRLPSLATDESLLHALGREGGPCDDVSVDTNGQDDAREAAGWPFFGQFLAHDLTADRSPLTHRGDARAIRNFRTPRLNLESLYGAGPIGSPFLYDRDDAPKLLLGTNDAGRPEDLPRNSQGIALVGDPRNDVHLFMAQLHVAVINFHNHLVDRLREDGVDEDDLFDEARRTCIWHYQWVVLHDFLPRLIGSELAERLTDGGASGLSRGHDGDGETPIIPLEFADAGYRYGHSQIRHQFRLPDGECLPVFPDLVGFRPVPAARVLDWALLFDLPSREPAQRAKKIDGRLPRSLIHLPVEISGEVADQDLRSLAVRDLERGNGVGLPSGETVAKELDVEPLDRKELSLPDGWKGETPLWYYVLKEAELRRGGDELGEVGGTIVGAVLVDVIEADPGSFLTVDPSWRPTVDTASDGEFGLVDLLLASNARA